MPAHGVSNEMDFLDGGAGAGAIVVVIVVVRAVKNSFLYESDGLIGPRVDGIDESVFGR